MTERAFTRCAVIIQSGARFCDITKTVSSVRSIGTGNGDETFRHAPVVVLVDGSNEAVLDLNARYGAQAHIISAAAFKAQPNERYVLVTNNPDLNSATFNAVLGDIQSAQGGEPVAIKVFEPGRGERGGFVFEGTASKN